jgi:hypothetical protein
MWPLALHYRLVRLKQANNPPHFMLTLIGIAVGLTAADMVGGGLLVSPGPLFDSLFVVLVVYGLVRRLVARR